MSRNGMDRYEIVFKYKNRKFVTKTYRANGFGSLEGMVRDMKLQDNKLKGAMITNLLTEEFIIV